jgi:hypothetical protein
LDIHSMHSRQKIDDEISAGMMEKLVAANPTTLKARIIIFAKPTTQKVTPPPSSCTTLTLPEHNLNLIKLCPYSSLTS